jgi:type IV pilus modification protein PilV
MKRSGNEGFTIIEVLQAMAISAIGLLALSSLTVSTISANAKARRITAGATLAADKMESIRDMAYAALSEGADEVSQDNVTFTRAWTVCTNCPIAGTKQVTLTVQWTEHHQQTVKLETVIAE